MAPRKVLSLGPDGLRNWPNSKQSYTDQGSRQDVLATNTPWVRLWAEWPILQPNKPDPTNPDPNKRYRVPNDLTINGPWAKFLLYVMYRYHPSNPQRGGIAHAVEVCNEPNYQMWPQHPTPNPDPATTTFIVNATAQMMQTAQAAKYVWGLKGAGPLLLAPGTSDHDTTDKDPTTGYVQHTDTARSRASSSRR